MKNLFEKRISAFDIPMPISEDERRRRLLNTFLWAFAVILTFFAPLIAGAALFFPDNPNVAANFREYEVLVFIIPATLAGILILIYVNRYLSTSAAGLIFVTLISLPIFFDTPEQISGGRSLLYFAFPIILSSLLIRRWASFAAALVTSVIIVFYSLLTESIPSIPAISSFWILAAIVWVATRNLDGYINKLGEVNAELAETKKRIQEQFLDADAELQRAKERLDELVVHSPAMIYSAHPFQYRTTFISRNVSLMMGYSQNDFTDSVDFWRDHIHPDDLPMALREIENLSARGKNVAEYRFLHADGGYRWMRDEKRVVSDEHGAPKEIVGSWIDITKEKEVRLALQKSEERYRALSEAGRDNIFIVDRQYRLEYVNQNLARAFALAPEDLVGMPVSQLFPAKIAERHRMNYERVFSTGEAALVEEINQFPDGERWMSAWLAPMKNQAGETVSVMGVARDISGLKSTEAALTEAKNTLEKRVAERTADLMSSREKLRQLTMTIVHAQEDERRRVSRELHDEAGQSLVGLKMSMDQILSEIPAELTEIQGKISKAIDEIGVTMSDIRALAHGLRPSALDVAGINIALSGLCQEFSEQTQLAINYEGMELPGLPDEISITLYRFVQEALTNIVKHARASTANVTLRRKDASIELIVVDNGQGFEYDAIRAAFGIHGMEERLSLLGGRLTIRSEPGQGAILHATLPWGAEAG